jgi:TRAP-type mannitol/chloroaromatic compound transport system substrate-binding protein
MVSKKIISVALSLCLIIVLSGCGGKAATETAGSSGDPSSYAPMKLTLESMGVSSSPAYPLFQKFADNVRAATGGKLDIDVQPVGAVVEYADLYNAVRDGVVDMATYGPATAVGFMGNKAYLIGASGVPGGLTGVQFVGWNYAYGGEKMIQDIFKEYGVTCISLSSVELAEVFSHSNKKIEKIQDFRGIKFRTMGIWGEVLQSVGANVTNIPGGELYSAIEKGIIDAFEYVGPKNNFELGFHEVAKYMTVPGVHSPVSVSWLLCNNAVYEKLPPEWRTILYDSSKAIALESVFVFKVEDARGMELFKKANAEIIHLSPETQRAIIEASVPIQRKFIAADPVYKKLFDSQKEYLMLAREQEYDLDPAVSVYDLID